MRLHSPGTAGSLLSVAGGLTSRRTACPWEVWMDVASRVIIDA